MYDAIQQDLTKKISSPPTPRRPDFGKAIKSLLREKSTSQKPLAIPWLATQSGIHEKTLFNIVSGNIRNPSWDKLEAVAHAFGIDVTELVARGREEWEGNFYTCGFKERAIIHYPQHGFTIQACTPPGTGNRDFFMGIVTIEPQRELRQWRFRDHAVVCAYVTDGTLEIEYGKAKKQIVSANESVYFDGGIEHTLRNIDTIPAKLIIATHPPIY